MNTNFLLCNNENSMADKLSELHSRCFSNPTEKYSSKSIAEFLDNKNYQVLANDACLGIIKFVKPEAEIITIAVDPQFRNQRYGSKLLNRLISIAKKEKINEIFLEVSINNSVAKKLYQNAGFCQIGHRKNYYRLNEISNADAILMHLEIKY